MGKVVSHIKSRHKLQGRNVTKFVVPMELKMVETVAGFVRGGEGGILPDGGAARGLLADDYPTLCSDILTRGCGTLV